MWSVAVGSDRERQTIKPDVTFCRSASVAETRGKSAEGGVSSSSSTTPGQPPCFRHPVTLCVAAILFYYAGRKSFRPALAWPWPGSGRGFMTWGSGQASGHRASRRTPPPSRADPWPGDKPSSDTSNEGITTESPARAARARTPCTYSPTGRPGEAAGRGSRFGPVGEFSRVYRIKGPPLRWWCVAAPCAVAAATPGNAPARLAGPS